MGKFYKIFIPDSILKQERRHRHKPREWRHVYFFRTQKKLEPFKTPVVEDFIPHSVKSFNKNTLYKDKYLSDKDDIFDYYKIMKTDTQERTAQLTTAKKQTPKKEVPRLTIKRYSDDNPFILTF